MGNHRYTAGLELKISQFWVQRLVVNPKTCAPMIGIILQKIEMSDNVIETKTLTNVSAIQRLLHLAEIVQCFFAENKKTPTFKELKEMTLVDFEDAPTMAGSSAVKAQVLTGPVSCTRGFDSPWRHFFGCRHRCLLKGPILPLYRRISMSELCRSGSSIPSLRRHACR